MKRLITSKRTLECLIILISINIILDGGGEEETRRLQSTETLNNNASTTTALPSFGNHYVTLYVGSPAQTQLLMVSLGSDYTTFPCRGCTNCGDDQSENLFFDYNNSLVHQCPEECAFEQSRCEDGSQSCIVTASEMADDGIEGSYRGFEVRDTVYLDTNGHLPTKGEGVVLDFVCQSQMRGLNAHSLFDGVISFSMAPSSFISQLVARGKIQERKFSLCYNFHDGYQLDGTSIGSIQLGEVNRQHHTSTLLWALNKGKATHPRANYAVQIKTLYLGIGGGNHPLLGAAQGTMSIIPLGDNVASFTPPEEWLGEAVIETSRAFTQLPKNFEDAFHAAFTQLLGLTYDSNGFQLEQYNMASLPTLFIQIEPHLHEQAGVPSDLPGFAGILDPNNKHDILLAVPPQNYLLYDKDAHAVTPTIFFSETVSFFGSNVLQGHEVVFDLDRGRIGFAEHLQCEKSLSLTATDPLFRGNDTGEEGNMIDGSPLQNNATTSTDGGTLVTANPEDGIPVVVSTEPEGTTTNSTNETVTVGGGAPPASEQKLGIPAANGRGTYHVGPGAVRAAQALEHMKKSEGLEFDFFHLFGIMILLASFSITVCATRDRTNSKRDTRFKPSDAPLFYSDPDLEKNAWNQSQHYQRLDPAKPHQPSGPDLEEATHAESEKMESFDDDDDESQGGEDARRSQRRSVGLQLWSDSTREMYKQQQPEPTSSFPNSLLHSRHLWSSESSKDDASLASKGSKGPSKGKAYDDDDEQSRISEAQSRVFEARARVSSSHSRGSDGRSRVSDEQSHFSEESEASYFVKKPSPSSRQGGLSTVHEDDGTENSSSSSRRGSAHSRSMALEQLQRSATSVLGSDVNMSSQRTPAGVRFLESGTGSDFDMGSRAGSRRASATSHSSGGGGSQSLAYSASEVSHPSRQPAGLGDLSGSFSDGKEQTSATFDEGSESTNFSGPSRSSLPGMGTTSSLPGIETGFRDTSTLASTMKTPSSGFFEDTSTLPTQRSAKLQDPSSTIASQRSSDFQDTSTLPSHRSSDLHEYIRDTSTTPTQRSSDLHDTSTLPSQRSGSFHDPAYAALVTRPSTGSPQPMVPPQGALQPIQPSGLFQPTPSYDHGMMEAEEEHEVMEEEQEEEVDYFPSPQEEEDEEVVGHFVPGMSRAGYLTTDSRQGDDDQSLLTMEEFPDAGSVSTHNTAPSRGEVSQAATQVSEATAHRGNQSGFKK